MKRLIITEKPSVAMAFGKALGISDKDNKKGYIEGENDIIVHCYGHLVSLAEPDKYNECFKKWKLEDLPILPKDFKYQVINIPRIKKQFGVIKKLLKSKAVSSIYVATDPAREGSFIYYLIKMLVDIPDDKPTKRVWVSAMTSEAILKAIDEAKDNSHYSSKELSGFCRAAMDWVIGMNYTRAYSILFADKLSEYTEDKKYKSIVVGRVMTCVLGLITERERHIREFKEEEYYNLHASMETDLGGSYEGKWESVDKNFRFTSEEEAIAFAEAIPTRGYIVDFQQKEEKRYAPELFNLTSLQSTINKKHKISVYKVSKFARELYLKGFITYSGTPSKHMETSNLSQIPGILEGLSKDNAFGPMANQALSTNYMKRAQSKKYMDNNKVKDHHCILPTDKVLNIEELSKYKLTNEHFLIYQEIALRFLAIFYPPAVTVRYHIKSDFCNIIFTTTEKRFKSLGYLEIYNESTKRKMVQEEEELGIANIQNIRINDNVQIHGFETKNQVSKPKTRYTDGSLLEAMETISLGTSDTRGEIIKKLIDLNYVCVDKKRKLMPTVVGEIIIYIVSNTAKDILQPEFTASWEKALKQIEDETLLKKEFMSNLYKYTEKIVNSIMNNKESIDIESYRETGIV